MISARKGAVDPVYLGLGPASVRVHVAQEGVRMGSGDDRVDNAVKRNAFRIEANGPYGLCII